jgi:hypothetical protein
LAEWQNFGVLSDVRGPLLAISRNGPRTPEQVEFVFVYPFLTEFSWNTFLEFHEVLAEA